MGSDSPGGSPRQIRIPSSRCRQTLSLGAVILHCQFLMFRLKMKG